MFSIRKAIWYWLMFAVFCGHVHAAPDTPHLADLHRDVWTGRDGAPTDIMSMTQTADGWLWMTTTSGLYRFDGVRFEHFQPRVGEALPDERLTNLYAAPDGALWFGYSAGGVSELRNGHVRLHASAQPAIDALLQAHQDPDGSLWLATFAGLLHRTGRTGDAWTDIGRQQGLPAGPVLQVFADQYGNVWANCMGLLYLRQRGARRFVPAGPPQTSSVISIAPDGRLWIDAHDRVDLIDAPHAGAALPVRPGYRPGASDPWLFDRAGNFWTKDCPAGLCLIHASALSGKTTFRVADMPKDSLASQAQKRGRTRTIFEDVEGNIWVATSEGLERYRPQRIDRMTMDERYDDFFIANDGTNALWVVAQPPGDLWHVAGAGAAPARVPGNFAYFGVVGNIGSPALFFSDRGIVQRADAQPRAAAIRDGAGKSAPLVRTNGGTFDGRHYWAVSDRGPVRLDGGQWRPLDALGFPPGAFGMNADRQGGAWLLYADKIVDASRTPWRAYGKANGLDIGQVHRVVPGDTVLVLGNSGVAAKVGDRFYPLRTSRPGMLSNALAGMQTANGDLWINARDFLVRVKADDWAAWLARPKDMLKTESFDNADGFAGARAPIPSYMATTDHGKRVWFVDQKGLASIDSTTIAYNRRAPRVEIVRLRSGARKYFSDDTIRLAAGSRNVSIDYTALSFIMPERLRFKYKLAGFDDDWQDSDARRTIDYTNLGPGSYRFQVLAANEDGKWSTLPATIAFSIAPLFTQTWWFFALCALAVLGALSVLYRVRVRSVRKHLADRLHERLHERERIARSLHDTYLQSVQGLVYVLQGLVHHRPVDDALAPLGRALVMADDVLIQGREQVLGLRMSARGTATLEQSLAEVGRALAESCPVTCRVGTSGEVRDMRGHVLEELFCIGREALLNACRHSRGTRVDITLHYEANKFTMTIADDGIGLRAAMLAHGNRAGHWGLPGMRERAETVNGTLIMSNLPGSGARIVLTVPGRTAYLRRGKRWWQS